MTEQELHDLQPLLLFDGVCNLCSRSVQFVITHERKPVIRFCSLQSEIGKTILEHFGIDSAVTDSLVLVDNGEARVKSDAVLSLSLYLKTPYRWLPVFRWVPRVVRNWIYDWIAKSRYRLYGKKEECWLPSPAIRKRFIDLG
jgi:predicted DCC family thiol-disulfide oxidoreductase YuxK